MRLLDQITASYTFEGKTTPESDSFTNADGTQVCYYDTSDKQMDGTDTVDVKSMPSYVIGLACPYTTNTAGTPTLIEGDVALNSNKAYTLTPGDNLCISAWHAYDLESILTHEFGHVWGLGDVPTEFETMAHVPACVKYPRTLAQGDLIGYRLLY